MRRKEPWQRALMQKANRRRRCAEVERLHLALYELELLRDGVTEVVAEARVRQHRRAAHYISGF
jgi:hypothetical protein